MVDFLVEQRFYRPHDAVHLVRSSRGVVALEEEAQAPSRSARVSSRKTFKFRLSPTKAQEQTLLFYLRRCRDLYNAGLEERRACYQMRHTSLSCYAQINELPDLKQAFPAYQELPSHVLQDVLRRLDKAFAAFFRRVRNGQTPGFPRFKSTSRYHSLTYPDQAGWKLGGKHLTLTGVGDVKIKLHREVQGAIKTVTIRRDLDQWYASFSCEVETEAPLPLSKAAVGLDLGVLHFATLSTGEHIENPRYYRKGLKRIKLLSQIKDRRQKGSHRRKRAALALAKAHRKVRHQRQDFQQQLSRRLVNEYGLLAMEDLSILNMTATPEPKPDPEHEGAYLPNGTAAKAGLNQSILDAGWGQFQQFCTYKAERAGRRVVLVDPKYTSQLCSGCGAIVKKELDERWHSCACGCSLDRDHNAALNILFRGEASGPRCYGVVEAHCFSCGYFTRYTPRSMTSCPDVVLQYSESGALSRERNCAAVPGLTLPPMRARKILAGSRCKLGSLAAIFSKPTCSKSLRIICP